MEREGREIGGEKEREERRGKREGKGEGNRGWEGERARAGREKEGGVVRGRSGSAINMRRRGHHQ